MDLAAHYQQLFKQSAKAILNHNYKLDLTIDDATDSRYGITLLIRPPEAVKNKIQSFLDQLKKVDDTQYFYPNSDIHITVLSIISCYEGFHLNQIEIEKYKTIINEHLPLLSNLEIDFNGITASDSAVMIQGFPSNDSLNNFRNTLRDAFKNSPLEQSIDSRYTLFTAHNTVCRFRKPIADTAKFISILEKYRQQDFGTFTVNEVELVCNDWYQRKKKTQVLHSFFLK